MQSFISNGCVKQILFICCTYKEQYKVYKQHPRNICAKVSSKHHAHNEPKKLSPGIMKEGLSLPWNTGDQAKNNHNTIGFKRAMQTKTKLTLA
jgi:hypothetical protein